MDEAETVHPAWAEIDLERLERNHHEVLRRIGPDIKLIASIKANAYGHGAVPVAKALVARGVYGLATGSFEEAAALRESGIDTKILMLATYLPEGIPELLRYLAEVYGEASVAPLTAVPIAGIAVRTNTAAAMECVSTQTETSSRPRVGRTAARVLRSTCFRPRSGPVYLARAREWSLPSTPSP